MPIKTPEDKPDKYIEEVWLGIKTATINTFSQKKDIIMPIDLDNISNNLNILQKEKNYSEIERIIVISIGQICRYYIINNIDSYNCHILDVQIKRWNKVTEKYQFFENQDIRNVVENCILFYIYFKAVDNYYKYANMIELFTTSDDIPRIEDIMEVSIINNYPIILDKANYISCVSEYVNTKFGTKVFKNTNGSKIISMLKSKDLL